MASSRPTRRPRWRRAIRMTFREPEARCRPPAHQRNGIARVRVSAATTLRTASSNGSRSFRLRVAAGATHRGRRSRATARRASFSFVVRCPSRGMPRRTRRGFLSSRCLVAAPKMPATTAATAHRPVSTRLKRQLPAVGSTRRMPPPTAPCSAAAASRRRSASLGKGRGSRRDLVRSQAGSRR